MLARTGNRIALLLATQALAFFKSTQQVAAVILWGLSLAMLLGFSLISLQERIGYIPFLGFLSGSMNFGGKEIWSAYLKASFVFYLLVLFWRALRPRKQPLTLRAKLKRAALVCLGVYALILLFVPFLRLATGESRPFFFWVIGLFGVATFLATIYAVCVTHGINRLLDDLHQKYGEQA